MDYKMYLTASKTALLGACVSKLTGNALRREENFEFLEGKCCKEKPSFV